MKTKKLSKIVGLVGTCLAIVPLTAGAAEMLISPTAGNPWLGNQNMGVRTDARSEFYSLDGEICVKDLYETWEWQTPIQADADNVNWTLQVAGEERLGDVRTRVMTLNSDGSVNTLTAWFSTTSTAVQTVGTAFLPTNGTLFAQSTLYKSFDADVTGERACVNMYRASR